MKFFSLISFKVFLNPLSSLLYFAIFSILTLTTQAEDSKKISDEYPRSKTTTSFFGDASGGLVFEIDDYSGNTLLYRLSFRTGARIVKRALGAENRVLSEKVLSVQEWSALAVSMRDELAGAGADGGGIQALEIAILPYRLTQNVRGIEPDIIEVVPAFLRLNANHNVTLDLRYANTSLQWNLIGSHLHGRGISAGFGAGYLQFIGPEDGYGRVWQQNGRVIGVISAVWAFSPKLVVRGRAEVIPLVKPDRFLEFSGGFMTQQEITVEYAVSKRFVAYARDRYDLFAVPTVRDDSILGLQGANFVEAGMTVRW